jgi:hypothetical protein
MPTTHASSLDPSNVVQLRRRTPQPYCFDTDARVVVSFSPLEWSVIQTLLAARGTPVAVELAADIEASVKASRDRHPSARPSS